MQALHSNQHAVNVASNCGYTYKNYNELIQLYDKYHSRGLEVLAFPSNQFGEQEPGSNEEIQTFCRNYGVTFPVFSKVLPLPPCPHDDADALLLQIDVNGPTAHPVYKFLKTSSDNSELPWNFVKVPLPPYHIYMTLTPCCSSTWWWTATR